jgi:hypothetical protein
MMTLLMWAALSQDVETQAADVRRLAQAGEVEKADEAYEKLLGDAAGRFEDAVRGAYEAVGRIEHERRLARRARNAARESIDALDEEGVRKSADTVRRLRRRPAAPDRELEDLAAEIDALGERVKTRIELRTLRLVLSGVGQRTVKRTVRMALLRMTLRVAETWAIINESLCQVGDGIAGTDARLEKVLLNGARVSLRGEIREIAIRRP